MKKRFSALLCALALTLGLFALPASADESLFFLALNDTLPAASSQTTPIETGGWVYVPASAFNNRVTGVNFGIYYGPTDNGEYLTFYNLSGKTLSFNTSTNTATTSTGAAVMPGRLVWRNGICYVPAYAICDYFGLTYSYYTTEYGPLLRIKDGNARLSDSAFLSSAESLMRSRYAAANPAPSVTAPAAETAPPAANPAPSTPSAPSAPSTPSTPASPQKPSANQGTKPAASAQSGHSATEQPQEPEPVKTFSLYLGLKANGDISAALDAMAAVNATAIVFFPTDKLDANADQIRQAAGRGHLVGLAPTGDTPAQRLESSEEGSRALARILRQETWFVLATDQELANAGYLTWAPTATVPGGSDKARYTAVYNAATGRNGVTRLLAGSDQPLAPLLRHFAQDGDTFLAPRETKY